MLGNVLEIAADLIGSKDKSGFELNACSICWGNSLVDVALISVSDGRHVIYARGK